MKLFFCVTISVLQYATVIGQGDILVQPPTIDSSSGLLDTTLSIGYGDFVGPTYFVRNARLLNGSLPGPTLMINAGDTMRILFQNDLSLQTGAVSSGENVYHNPDHSNLHFHGGHVSGELPSDDVRMAVAPGESYQYETHFPSNHLPGTHWIHPHVHGSSALQVGAGAAAAMIVRDPDGFLPSQIADAEDVLLFVQDMNFNTLQNVVRDIGDGMTDVSGSTETDFRLVNGQYQPVVNMRPGEWQRWRVVHAGWLVDTLDFAFAAVSASSCEMYLLAKDGIYVQDYPRSVNLLPIPAGGRADVMVRCSATGNHNVLDYDGRVLLTASVSGTAMASSDLEPWAPDYPAYLTDLTNTAPTNGCDCDTSLARCGDRFCLNNNLFDDDVYLHTVAFGSVVERTLNGFRRHPYHQHVYPFQLVGGVDGLGDADEDVYFRTGDWHDVMQANTGNGIVMRYRPDVHDGVIMLHCHILTHEDEGTMTQELVVEGGNCECDALHVSPYTAAPTDGATTASPTVSPTVSPTTSSPTSGPTAGPTLALTSPPSAMATDPPTVSSRPSLAPSASTRPTTTSLPSSSPSDPVPSVSPSANPTSSLAPTSPPSVSVQPTVTAAPSESPSTTGLPTNPPTLSAVPTTVSPTSTPTTSVSPTTPPPTDLPTTSSPTLAPTTPNNNNNGNNGGRPNGNNGGRPNGNNGGRPNGNNGGRPRRSNIFD